MNQMHCASSHIYHHQLNHSIFSKHFYEWKAENLISFDELLLSWNALRPLKGYYVLSLSLKIRAWSSWIVYAHWGAQEQKSFVTSLTEPPIYSFQDTVMCLEGQMATGFHIRIESREEADLKHFFALHACVTRLNDLQIRAEDQNHASIQLKVPGLSQMTVSHPRHRSFCSPVSTTAVIHYLTRRLTLLPTEFAQKVLDTGFDIYGNWVFNAAQAFVELGPTWQCWVERYTEWKRIIRQLQLEIPVVVSIRGPLFGSPLPYDKGHLLVVQGYHAPTQRVLCMDPAFPSNEQTHVWYALSDFMQAWSRRRFVAYHFQPKIPSQKPNAFLKSA